MGRRNKDRSRPTADQNEALQRMNYLYQAAFLLSLKPEARSKNINMGISRSLIQRMKIVGQKTQVRIVPELKADVCKICHTPQHLYTCQIEILEAPSSNSKTVQKTCKACGFVKKLKRS